MCKHTWTWMHMNSSVCVKRIHQFRLPPMFIPTTRRMQFSYWHQQNIFCCTFCAFHTHQPMHIRSAAKGTSWNFSSLNSLSHNLFVTKTALGEMVLVHILSKAGSGETLLAGAPFCYLFLSPAMLAGSSTLANTNISSPIYKLFKNHSEMPPSSRAQCVTVPRLIEELKAKIKFHLFSGRI